MTDTAVQQWTQEQVERLARDFMLVGYTVFDGQVWSNAYAWPWNPFTDANADYQVLQRARETWAVGAMAHMRGNNSRSARDDARYWGTFYRRVGQAAEYHVGGYARAVLAVLDSQETD